MPGAIEFKNQKLYISLLAIPAILLILIPTALASGNPGNQELSIQDRLEIIEDMIKEAIEIYRAGDVDEAYRIARNAYLDHFEIVEIPLRSIDPDYTLEMEIKFAEFREMIRSKNPIEEVETKGNEILIGLDKVSRLLEDPRIMATISALLTLISFSIMLREGFEAILLISIITSLIVATKSFWLKKHVAIGVAIAIISSIATWILMNQIIGMATRFRPIIEAVLTTVAVGILFYISFWILNNTHTRKWLEFIKAKVWEASARGTPIAIIILTFSTIYREGVETAIFYQTLLLTNIGMEIPIFTGAVVGFGALGILSYIVFIASKRIPTKLFFTFTMTITAYLSIVFIGTAVRELQELGVIGVTVLEYIPKNRILVDLVGIYPTLETLLSQITLLTIYIAGYIYMARRSFG